MTCEDGAIDDAGGNYCEFHDVDLRGQVERSVSSCVSDGGSRHAHLDHTRTARWSELHPRTMPKMFNKSTEICFYNRTGERDEKDLFNDTKREWIP